MFANIIGQQKIKTFITHELVHDSLSYGYIIYGDKLMGKSFIAHEVADEITVPSYIIDVVPADGRKLIQVDDIRTLKEDVYSSSFSGEKKVYIVENSEKMTVSAQNAFLKILEEPPQDCIFFLLAENRFKLLETIRSRCTLLPLERYSDKEICSYLEQKGFNGDNESIRLCNGAINRWEYLQNPQFEHDVMDLTFKILFNIMKLHPARVFAITKHLRKIKDNIEDVLDIFLICYRDVYVYKLLKNDSYIELSSRVSQIHELAEQYSEQDLLQILDKILWSKRKLELNCNFNMTVEMLLLKMRRLI